MPYESNTNHDDDHSQPDPVDEAFVAYLKALDAGGDDSREEFVQRFPELRSQLSELLDAADLIEQLAGGTSRDLKRDPGANTRGVAATGIAMDDLDATLPVTPVPGEDAGPKLPFEMGDYVLERVLGRGGMGVVYLARQKNLDRPVAVKMIRSGMLAGSDEIKRFSAEAKAAARLKHPNIVGVHHFGLEGGHYYFSMDFVAGSDLSKIVDSGPLDPRHAARYVRDVALAIHHAHERGLLHRDLKPANVLIDENDQIHVTDFGLAKQVDAESSLTNSGAAIGTPNYMAPEQANGDHSQTCRQSDVYSLGAILFALITGRPPFVTDSVMQTLLQVIHKPAPSLRSMSDAPEDLETIVAKCLTKDPAERYPSAEALADDLERFLKGRPITALPRTRLQRCVDFLCDVPLFAVLLGRRSIHPTDAHERFQSLMLLSGFTATLVLSAAFFGSHLLNDRMPSQPKIAGGPIGDAYDRLASGLAERLGQSIDRKVETLQTEGSVENLEHLVSGDVDLAILQASAVRGEQVSVIAPLYYEALHVLARSESRIENLSQVEGTRVAIGGRRSGSQLAAHMLFESFHLDEKKIDITYQPLSIAQRDPKTSVVIACIARGSESIRAVLTSKAFRLLSIDQAVEISLDHPTFRPLQIRVDDYGDVGLPAEGISTIGTTAFLATRSNAPDSLVTAVLKALYEDGALLPGMISRQHAAEWQGLALHRAARAFYESE
ncbi:MAG: serine/threonine-protein kinase [Pirellulaceae bacterium]